MSKYGLWWPMDYVITKKVCKSITTKRTDKYEDSIETDVWAINYEKMCLDMEQVSKENNFIA